MKIDLKKLPVINRDEALYNKLIKLGYKIYITPIDKVVYSGQHIYELNTNIKVEITYETPTGRKRNLTFKEWYAYVNDTAESHIAKLKKKGYQNIKAKAVAVIKYLTKYSDGWHFPVSEDLD